VHRFTDKLQIENKEAANYQNRFHRLRVNLLYMNNWIRVEANGSYSKSLNLQQQFNVRILRGQIGVNTSFSTQTCGVLLDKMSDTSRLVDRLACQEK
jgi:hypothetical protein